MFIIDNAVHCERLQWFFGKCWENEINEINELRKFQSSKVLSRFSINVIQMFHLRLTENFVKASHFYYTRKGQVKVGWYNRQIGIFQQLKSKMHGANGLHLIQLVFHLFYFSNLMVDFSFRCENFESFAN